MTNILAILFSLKPAKLRIGGGKRGEGTTIKLHNYESYFKHLCFPDMDMKTRPSLFT